MKLSHILIVLTLTLIVTGCRPQAQVAELPTLAVLPSLTSTVTQTRTPIPTWTPTFTFTPPGTATFTPTSTFTPTMTSTVTPSLTPTFTLTYTPTVTATSTPLPTSELPGISRLEVVPDVIPPGGTVTLRWIADAERVILEIQDSQGTSLEAFDLPTRGERSITFPATLRGLVILKLTSFRGSVQSSRSAAVTILGCASTWFFDQNLIDDDICPSSAAASAEGRYQEFERGHMVWVPTNGINRVFILYGGSNNGDYVTEPEQDLDGSIGDPPNDDLEKPENQFEGVWADTTAPDGVSWQDKIGWGESDSDRYDIRVQYEEGSQIYYIGVGSEIIFRIDPDNTPDDGEPEGDWSVFD